MKRKSLVLLFLTALTGLLSCYRDPAPDGKQTREQFAASVKTFPYTASEQRRAQLIDNYPRLSVGMSKQQVASILGDPDYTDITGCKSFFGLKPDGSLWVYGIYCTSQWCGIYGEDRMIQIFFNMDDRAIWIIPKKVEELVGKDGRFGRS